MLRSCIRQTWRGRETKCHKLCGLRYSSTFVENDYVLLEPASSTTYSRILGGPLRAGKKTRTTVGEIEHEQIIGQQPRTLLVVNPGKRTGQYRVHHASLDDYIRLTRRVVTPIYPSDANLIVSLFDLHPEHAIEASTETKVPTICILEAGTGHGSLTLYLSRAIHAANRVAPKLHDYDNAEAYEVALNTWKSSRAAVIKTVDISSAFSQHASNIVRGFRHGMYHDNVDFHVSNVGLWVQEALADHEGQPFITHAFLDLPNADAQVEVVAKALHTNSPLIVFAPSISQLMELFSKIKEEGKVPLDLDKVIELGVNNASGGREWVLRHTRPRATQRSLAEAKSLDTNDQAVADEIEGDSESSSEVEIRHSAAAEADSGENFEKRPWVTVCRPKVGDRIAGGGFLALFRKQLDPSQKGDGMGTHGSSE